MAMNLLSDVSARYSFSHDISLPSLDPSQTDLSELDPGIDFEFGIDVTFYQESSSADELFSQGILLPRELRDKCVLTSKQQQQQPTTEEIKEIPENASMEPSTFLESEEKTQSKTSFWNLKRSTSLNLNPGSECNKKGFLCTLQEGLSRSNSTGSVPNPKKQNKDKAVLLHSGKHPPLPKSSSTSSSSTNSSYNHYHHKQQHPKCYYGAPPYSPGRGSRTNPVLNVPPPYISNTNLFSLGSLFRNGKDKKPKNSKG